MKFTNDQFEAVAYIFERENGNKKSEFEKKIITKSELENINPKILESNIIEGIEKGIYEDSTNRISAYWALSKRYKQNLIPYFQKWLREELKLNEDGAIYQLLISLGNMGEPVFNLDRDGSTTSLEKELNIRDAKDYLNKIST